jgi:hypothetical protein
MCPAVRTVDFKQRSAFKPGQGAELDGNRYHEAPLIKMNESIK